MRATSDFVFLPERLTLSPVVPAYRYGDQAFGLIVDWTVRALIEAEALGITHDNVAEAAKREDMRADQSLGHDFATAQALGLAHDWARQGDRRHRQLRRDLSSARPAVRIIWTEG